jgi:hypothetical protein
MLRVVAVVAGLASAFPAMAGEMTASEARQFVVEKLFSYTCFDGTRPACMPTVQWLAPSKSEAGYHVMAVCRSAPCVLAATGSARICAAP